jgi:hypothetical protein
MRTIPLYYLSFLVLFSFFIVACEPKEEDVTPPVESVAQPENWHFSVEQRSFSMADSSGSFHQYQYDGTVEKLSDQNLVRINYGTNTYMNLTLHSNGEFSGFGSPYSSGRMIGNDSLYIYHRTGGMGGGSTLVIEGKKQ